jgi:hypothetical protein
MIKSKFQHTTIPAFWILLSVIIFLFLGELYYLYSRFINIQRGEIHRDVIISLIIILSFILFASLWLKESAAIITINTDQNTITFTNFFTKKAKTYFLNNFDGYIHTIDINSKTRTQYKVLFLLKDKKIVRKISGSFYSNIEELQEGLKSLNDLGFEKFGITKKLKMFFKQPVLE